MSQYLPWLSLQKEKAFQIPGSRPIERRNVTSAANTSTSAAGAAQRDRLTWSPGQSSQLLDPSAQFVSGFQNLE